MCGINRRLSGSFVGSVVSGEKVWLVRKVWMELNREVS